MSTISTDRPNRYKPRHRRTVSRRMVVALASALALIGLGCGAAPDDAPVRPNPPAETQAGTAQARKAKPAEPTIGDGQHAVGADIKAGTYTTTVPEDSFGCYWARVNDFEGELQSIIANGNLDTGAKGRIVVKSSDAGVEFNGGCEWKKAAK
jgi:hypothetical protein